MLTHTWKHILTIKHSYMFTLINTDVHSQSQSHPQAHIHMITLWLTILQTFYFNKISTVQFYQWRLRSQMLGWKPASSERQRKHPADLPPQPVSQQQAPPPCCLRKPPSNWTPLPSTSCTALYPSSRLPLILYGFFLNNSTFTSCNWLLAPPLDLWLTLFNSVYRIKKQQNWD